MSVTEGVRAGESTPPAAAPASLRTRTRPRRRASVAGVLGELLITAGVIVLLYVVWQLWVGDWIFAAQRNSEGQALSQEWQSEYEDSIAPSGPSAPEAEPAAVEIPVLPQPADTEIFANLLVPRWGSDYLVPIAGGVTRSGTLDNIGIGHYPGTAMPGEVGNVSLAAHRMTSGAPFGKLPDLRVGDALVIETPDGWYTYRFRTHEYVTPSQVDVLLPVPQMPEVPTGERYLTIMTCSPLYSMAERLIGYSVFESFTPRSDGPPASLTEGVA